MVAVALTVVCALATAALVACEWRWRPGRRVAKPIASAAFVLLPIAAAAPLNDPAVIAIMVGLVLGAAGDIALLGESRRALAVGIALFLAGHIAYVVAFVPHLEVGPAMIGTFVAASVVGVIAATLVWPTAGTLRPAVVAYIIVIVAMVTTALGVRGDGATLIAMGGVLFFASDLAVARQRFMTKSIANKALGLPAYYAAQLLIAWSCVA